MPLVRSRPMVLVVEDDQALCSSLKFALETEGFAVRTYANGPALLAEANGHDAHCLVIDYRLPEMNGLELIGQLRASGVGAPAILITTNPTSAVLASARRAKTQIIEKPLLTNALSDAIRRAIAGTD